jgi:hypothetical protein
MKIKNITELVDRVSREPIDFKQAVKFEKTVTISEVIETKIDALTDTSNVLYSNLSKGTTVFNITLDANKELAEPANGKAGTTYAFIFTQDGTGDRTLTYDSVFKFPGGNTPALSTGANEVDVLVSLYDGTNFLSSLTRNFS